MAVISFSNADEDIFIMKKRLLRLLLEKAEAHTASPDDVFLLRQAVALDGLLFETIATDQRRQLAVAVAAACREVRQMLHQDVHAIDRGFDSMLQKIQARLHTLTDGSEDHQGEVSAGEPSQEPKAGG